MSIIPELCDSTDTAPKSINILPPTENIFQGCDAAGWFYFRQNLHDSRNTRGFSSNAVVALGLTEVCCSIGQGKVCDDWTLSIEPTKQGLHS